MVNKDKAKDKAKDMALDRVARLHLRTGDKREDRRANKGKCNNVISTTKYSLVTFLPKNLFEQFMRVANFYFLVMMCIALVPGLSPITPITSVLPLAFVISVAMIKQGYEDYLRYCLDKKINHKISKVVQHDGSLLELRTQEVRVGDLVYVEDGEDFPCDLISLTSSAGDGNCSIVTANLDGETGLKIRSTPPCTRHMTKSDFAKIDLKVTTGKPVADLYKFAATMDVVDRGSAAHSQTAVDQTGGEPHTESHTSLDTSNILLKGARLKGTEWVLGMAVMTGKETKLGQNQRPITRKVSSAESRLNRFLLLLLLMMIGSCSFSVVYQHHLDNQLDRFWPVTAFEDVTNDSPFTDGVCDGDPDSWQGYLEIQICDFLQFMILYSYLIPISLYVTLELQKMVGALLIGWDKHLYDHDLDEPAVARASDLNEELALVEHVFADKTGTLTENIMAFQKVSVKGCGYAYCPRDDSIDPVTTATNTKALQDCFLTLAICNTVQVKIAAIKVNGHEQVLRTYNSSSTDEEALVKAAACSPVGTVLLSRTPETIEVGCNDQVVEMKILHIADFSSKRMRMSVIAQSPSGQTTVYCKGADGRVLTRVKVDSEEDATNLERSQAHLRSYSREGLRTLAVAKRDLEPEYAAKLLERIAQAKSDIVKRNDLLEEIYDEMEAEMDFLGVTAVEDRLQEGVQDCMKKLRQGGCSVWMLTGDKKETAQSISLTAAHTSDDMKFFDACGFKDEDECRESLKTYLRTLERDHGPTLERDGSRRRKKIEVSYSYSLTGVGGRKTPASDKHTGRYGHALIIDGQSVAIALEHCEDLLFRLTSGCASVLGCRLSPIQKALIVKLIRSGGPEVDTGIFKKKQKRIVTLAIGDGANDVAMIREADIGVGILGKEGREAANSSDYAFGKFKSLAPLLLVHGHLSYQRIGYTILYFGYKNVATVFPLFLYGFQNLFSTQPLFDSWMIMCYNMIFTALPVLFYGMFEMDLTYDELLKYPSVYKDFENNSLLSYNNFLSFTANGMLHGAIAYYGILLALSTTPIDRDSDLDGAVYGLAVYTSIFVVVNVRIMMDTRHWTIITHFGMWVGTFGSFIAFILMYTGVPDIFGDYTTPGIYWSAYVMFSDPKIVSAMLVVITFSIFFDMMIIFVRQHFRPSRAHKIQNLRTKRKSRFPCCLRDSYDLEKLDPSEIEYDEKAPLLIPRASIEI